MNRQVCQHCHQRFVNRPSPGVRELYPSTGKSAVRGVPDFNGRIVLPSAPTSALPGTAEKIEVLTERARLGVALFHPLDASMDAEGDAAFRGVSA
jgi:hypothetical protein